MPKVLTNYIVKDKKIILLSNDMVFPDLPIATVDYGREYSEPELIDDGSGIYQVIEHSELEHFLKVNQKEAEKNEEEIIETEEIVSKEEETK